MMIPIRLSLHSSEPETPLNPRDMRSPDTVLECFCLSPPASLYRFILPKRRVPASLAGILETRGCAGTDRREGGNLGLDVNVEF